MTHPGRNESSLTQHMNLWIKNTLRFLLCQAFRLSKQFADDLIDQLSVCLSFKLRHDSFHHRAHVFLPRIHGIDDFLDCCFDGFRSHLCRQVFLKYIDLRFGLFNQVFSSGTLDLRQSFFPLLHFFPENRKNLIIIEVRVSVVDFSLSDVSTSHADRVQSKLSFFFRFHSCFHVSHELFFD